MFRKAQTVISHEKTSCIICLPAFTILFSGKCLLIGLNTTKSELAKSCIADVLKHGAGISVTKTLAPLPTTSTSNYEALEVFPQKLDSR